MSTRFAEQYALATSSGASLNMYHQPATGAPRGVVHVNHGLAEHAARYGRFARALSAAGIATYAHDHRGHGATTAPDAPARSFSTQGTGVDKLIDDVAAVHMHIRARHDGVPIILFGHSMGGLIAMNHALRHPDTVAGVAVWNANFSGGLAGRGAQAILGWERFRLGSDVPSRRLPKLTFGQWGRSVSNRRTEFDWLSDLPAEVDAYIADPLCGWDASVGMWQDVLAMILVGGNVRSASQAAKALPFHLAGGAQDPATGCGKAVAEQAARMKKAGFGDVTLTIYPETRHETLNASAAPAATTALIDWIGMHL